MLTYRFSLLLMAAACLCFAPVGAQDESQDATEPVSTHESKAVSAKKKKNKAKKAGQDAAAEPGAVAKALSDLKTLKGKPNLKAEYYVYMCSASWCRFCCECMPVAVDVYKKMKRSKKVELVLLNGDKSEKAAKSYMKNYKAKFPYVMFDEVKNAKFGNLPGSSAAIGFPAAAVVDKDGNVISRAVGAGNVKNLLGDWQQLTIERENAAE